jgi:hypothetical protein
VSAIAPAPVAAPAACAGVTAADAVCDLDWLDQRSGRRYRIRDGTAVSCRSHGVILRAAVPAGTTVAADLGERARVHVWWAATHPTIRHQLTKAARPQKTAKQGGSRCS